MKKNPDANNQRDMNMRMAQRLSVKTKMLSVGLLVFSCLMISLVAFYYFNVGTPKTVRAMGTSQGPLSPSSFVNLSLSGSVSSWLNI